MRGKGSRFTPGVWGLRVCSLDVAFMFATVRNRPREPRMAVPMVSSAKGVSFGYLWRLHMSRCFVSRGMRGTSWHPDVFCKVSKIVLCGRPNTFATFSEDALQFSWRKSRTKCSFWRDVSRLESLVFLWPRRVYGGSCKTSPFRRSPSRLSRFAWQARRFVTFQPVW